MYDQIAVRRILGQGDRSAEHGQRRVRDHAGDLLDSLGQPGKRLGAEPNQLVLFVLFNPDDVSPTVYSE
jgi:hypothetical protein